MSDKVLIVEMSAAGYAVVTLNRPLAMNALSVPEMLAAYKSLVDDGFAMNLADGLRLERQRSTAWNAEVNSQQIEARRTDVRQRGSAQAGGA